VATSRHADRRRPLGLGLSVPDSTMQVLFRVGPCCERGECRGPSLGGEVAYSGVVAYLEVDKSAQVEVVGEDVANIGGVLLDLTGGLVGSRHCGSHFSAVYKIYQKAVLPVGY